MLSFRFIIIQLALFASLSISPLYGWERYKLIFSDEFNQPNFSCPDSTKWNFHARYPGIWSRWISSSPDVIFIKDSALVCRAIPNKDKQVDTSSMLTSAINTLGKFDFKYGRVDVRMKTNVKQGNFPAVWMRPTINPNSPYGEIDIVEMFGNQNKAFHTIHSHRTYTLKCTDIPSSFNEELDVEQWHTYSVEWTRRKVVWFVDGKVVAEYAKRKGRKMRDEGQWSFDRPFYIILNQSVGDNSRPFFMVDTNQIYETQFNWIRVYKKRW